MAIRTTVFCIAFIAAANLALPISLVPQSALAQTATSANIQATHVVANIPPDDPDGGLNVRMGGDVEFSIITTLKQGTPVSVKRYNSKQTWALISYGSGNQGWVHTAYLAGKANKVRASKPVTKQAVKKQTIAPRPVVAKPAVTSVVSEPSRSTKAPDGRRLPANYTVSIPAKSQLAVRQRPNSDATLLGTYDAGDNVRAIGWMSNGWVEVQIDNASTGFLHGRHLIR
ncbi:MAG: SH3 domain-containing protein [Cohaesibacteraceae bacterium]|nr:SH3 domain-containing protein [Cohaesibacteraceae bacterium]